MNILILDDEIEIAQLIELYLVNEGYTTFLAHNGASALDIVHRENIDLAILDLMLPDIDGFQIAEKIRENYTFPIIMLTAKTQDIDKVKGFNIGADDYITKPFKPIDLVARVKAHLRRYKQYNSPLEEKDILETKDLKIYLKEHRITLNDQVLKLTPIEFDILKILIENKNYVVSSEDIFQKVWKEKYFLDANNTVMVHIRNLRKKMGQKSKDVDYIKTVWGVGYKIEE